MGLATWNSTNGRQKRVQLRALGGNGRADSPHEQGWPGGVMTSLTNMGL